MKLIEYFKIRKNRYTWITVNIIMSLILSFFSVYLDAAIGSASLKYIYVLQVICFINWGITFSLVIWNIFNWAGRRLNNKK